MRFTSPVALVLALSLSACNRGVQNKDAVRQGVLDYLASRPNLSMTGMNVDVTKVDFRGKQAEATVSFTPKGGPAGNGMQMRYTLEQKDNRWQVVSKADSGQNPHGAGSAQSMPGMPNPHAGGAPGGIDTETPRGTRPPSDPK